MGLKGSAALRHFLSGGGGLETRTQTGPRGPARWRPGGSGQRFPAHPDHRAALLAEGGWNPSVLLREGNPRSGLLGGASPPSASRRSGEGDSGTGARASPPAFVPLSCSSHWGQACKEVGAVPPAHLHALAQILRLGLHQCLECASLSHHAQGALGGVWWLNCSWGRRGPPFIGDTSEVTWRVSGGSRLCRSFQKRRGAPARGGPGQGRVLKPLEGAHAVFDLHHVAWVVGHSKGFQR